MSVLSAIRHMADDFRTARTRYWTERQLNALPNDIRKDIGWPPVGSAPSNIGTGHWAGSR